MSSKETHDQNAIELGETIRKLRLGQVQAINGRSWSQDDLAVAIGSDKSHISRLEKGHQLPNPKTLNRICDVLGVSWSVRKNLLALAGQYLTLPAPTEDEVDRIIQCVEPQMELARYAVALEDIENTVWAINDIEAFAFYGYPTKEKFINECSGLSFIELMMAPRFCEWFQKIIVDYDRYFYRQVLRFKELYLKYKQVPEYQNLLLYFLRQEDFRKAWVLAEKEQTQETGIDFLNHQVLEINHPQLGRYHVQCWHATLVCDDRFKFVAMMADDVNTIQMYEDLYQWYRKKNGFA